MIAVLSTPKLEAAMREMFDIDPNMSRDEMILMHDSYEQKMFPMLEQSGLTFAGQVGREGSLFSWRFTLHGSPLDGRDIIQQALVNLKVVAVTLEPDDLTVMCPNAAIRAGMLHGWNEIEDELSRVPPAQLLDRIEQVGPRITFNGTANLTEATESFETWAMRNELRIPTVPKFSNEIDVQEAERKANEQRWLQHGGDDESAGWGWREM